MRYLWERIVNVGEIIKLSEKMKKKRNLAAKINKMLYIKPDIFFDESGNTGGNLLDPLQPVLP